MVVKDLLDAEEWHYEHWLLLLLLLLFCCVSDGGWRMMERCEIDEWMRMACAGAAGAWRRRKSGVWREKNILGKDEMQEEE